MGSEREKARNRTLVAPEVVGEEGRVEDSGISELMRKSFRFASHNHTGVKNPHKDIDGRKRMINVATTF